MKIIPLSSWLREDGKHKEEREVEVDKETQRRDRQKEEEKDENETVSAKRRCVGSVTVEAFYIFSQGEDLECCGGFSWRDLLEEPDDLSDCDPETRTDVSAVHDVTVVLVSPSSVLTECSRDVFFFRTENLLNRSPLLQEACFRLDRFTGRDEA